MRGIVKGFVVGTLGLVVLFGSPALGLAGVSAPQLRPKIQKYSQCQCVCEYYNERRQLVPGVLTFLPQANNTSCTFTAIDIYVPCKDSAGVVHPGVRFTDCKLIPGIVAPGVKPPAKQ